MSIRTVAHDPSVPFDFAQGRRFADISPSKTVGTQRIHPAKALGSPHHHAPEDVLGDADGRFPVDPEIGDHDLSMVCASFGAISRQPFQPQ